MSRMHDDCVFCGIVAGRIPADVVHETPTVLAFRDLQPQAPLHVLVDTEPGTVSELVRAAGDVVRDAGHDSYRLVLNTGSEAGQTVFHTHLHVLAGRPLAWPPG
jgi:histidine triad (HIT) family protein